MRTRITCLTFGLLAVVSQAHAAPTTRPACEFIVDTSDVPEMAAYGERVKKLLELWYPKLVEGLPSAGFTPPAQVTIIIKNRPDGVAEASGGRITATAKWFKDRPEDIGAFVHELAHVVQAYDRGDRPGWLVEGIADYVRWFEYEPLPKRPRPNPERANYDDSYQTSAHFLNYVQNKYDKKLVVKLNAACRQGNYDEALWKKFTGKSLADLGAEWKSSLKDKKAK